MKEILQIVWLWCCGLTVSSATYVAGFNASTIQMWFAKCRDICSRKLISAKEDFQFGGKDVIVQIDESVVAKRKYHRGKFVPIQWVFGIVDTNTRTGYLELVKDRSEKTLLPIILEKIKPGSIIHSDMWRAYSNIASHGYIHKTVNHSKQFKDPISGCHTNLIEAYWSAVKRSLKRQAGKIRRSAIPEHLDEFMWRERYGVRIKYYIKNGKAYALGKKKKIVPWFRKSRDPPNAWRAFWRHAVATANQQ